MHTLIKTERVDEKKTILNLVFVKKKTPLSTPRKAKHRRKCPQGTIC